MRRARFIHYGTAGDYAYEGGRHSMIRLNNSAVVSPPYWGLSGFVVKWEWTPWPEVVARKLAVGKHIAKGDVAAGVSIQHTLRARRGRTGLVKERQRFIQKCKNQHIHLSLEPLSDQLKEKLLVNRTLSVEYHSAIWQPRQRMYKPRSSVGSGRKKKKRGPRENIPYTVAV